MVVLAGGQTFLKASVEDYKLTSYAYTYDPLNKLATDAGAEQWLETNGRLYLDPSDPDYVDQQHAEKYYPLKLAGSASYDYSFDNCTDSDIQSQTGPSTSDACGTNYWSTYVDFARGFENFPDDNSNGQRGALVKANIKAYDRIFLTNGTSQQGAIYAPYLIDTTKPFKLEATYVLDKVNNLTIADGMAMNLYKGPLGAVNGEGQYLGVEIPNNVGMAFDVYDNGNDNKGGEIYTTSDTGAVLSNVAIECGRSVVFCTDSSNGYNYDQFAENSGWSKSPYTLTYDVWYEVTNADLNEGELHVIMSWMDRSQNDLNKFGGYYTSIVNPFKDENGDAWRNLSMTAVTGGSAASIGLTNFVFDGQIVNPVGVEVIPTTKDGQPYVEVNGSFFNTNTNAGGDYNVLLDTGLDEMIAPTTPITVTFVEAYADSDQTVTTPKTIETTYGQLSSIDGAAVGLENGWVESRFSFGFGFEKPSVTFNTTDQLVVENLDQATGKSTIPFDVTVQGESVWNNSQGTTTTPLDVTSYNEFELDTSKYATTLTANDVTTKHRTFTNITEMAAFLGVQVTDGFFASENYTNDDYLKNVARLSIYDETGTALTFPYTLNKNFDVKNYTVNWHAGVSAYDISIPVTITESKSNLVADDFITTTNDAQDNLNNYSAASHNASGHIDDQMVDPALITVTLESKSKLLEDSENFTRNGVYDVVIETPDGTGDVLSVDSRVVILGSGQVLEDGKPVVFCYPAYIDQYDWDYFN